MIYTAIYMSKVLVYIPAMKLKMIDLYCKEHKTSRSKFLTNTAMSIINAKGKVRCSFCYKPSIGKYQILAYDPVEGERIQEKHLCVDDYKKAELEGVEIKEL
jgi:hypothetical protein